MSNVIPLHRTNEDADRAAWLEARRRGVGGSEVAAALGMSRYCSAYTLFCQKHGLVTNEQNDRMLWGHRHENTISEWYAELTGYRVVSMAEAPPTLLEQIDPHATVERYGRNVLLRSRLYPWLCGTPDRMAYRPGHGWGVIDLKATHERNLDAWRSHPPEPYVLQVMTYMFLTGASWGALAALFGLFTPGAVDFERDDDLISFVISGTKRFWDRVTLLDPPPVDGEQNTRDTLSQVMPPPTGRVAFPPECMQWDRDYTEALEREKAAAADKKTAYTRIMAALGTNEVGVMPDGTTWRATVNKRGQRVLRRS